MRYSLAQEDKPDDRVRAVLLEAFRGNEAAVAFIETLAGIVHTWDDLIDRDKPVAPDEIHAAFTGALVGLNLNPFFRQHSSMLTPLLLNGILNWHAANELESCGDPDMLPLAHVIRCSVGDVALMAAFLIGGMDHAKAHAAGLRVLMQQDSLKDYLKDHGYDAD